MLSMVFGTRSWPVFSAGLVIHTQEAESYRSFLKSGASGPHAGL